MSNRRKQRFNPIEYKEKPPAWMTMPEPKTKTKFKKEEPVAIIETTTETEEPEVTDDQEYETEMYVVEGEGGYVLEAVEVQKPRVPKEKTKEFVRKEMEKLCATLDDLIDFDDTDFVVNFVLEMSAQAKRKTWELQGFVHNK